MVDAYFYGKAERISPEAPVPIVAIKNRDYRLGGAANVAINLKSLGATPLLCSVIGEDSNGTLLKNLLQGEGLSAEGIISSADRVTTVKTRIISNYQQMLRVDEERIEPLSGALKNSMLAYIGKLVESQKPDAIVFEDYDKGSISSEFIAQVMEIARQHAIPVSVDPKRERFMHYAGATLFKPNLKELEEGLGLRIVNTSKEHLVRIFRMLKSEMAIEKGLFTLSGKGIFITNGQEAHHFPAHLRNISDVSGAGDTVISVATCALAIGLGMAEIAWLANLSGGLVCEQPGVVAIDPEKLKKEIIRLIPPSS